MNWFTKLFCRHPKDGLKFKEVLHGEDIVKANYRRYSYTCTKCGLTVYEYKPISCEGCNNLYFTNGVADCMLNEKQYSCMNGSRSLWKNKDSKCNLYPDKWDVEIRKKASLLQALSSENLEVLQYAYLCAMNQHKYGVNISEKWSTAVQQASALKYAYDSGRYDAMDEMECIMRMKEDNKQIK